MNRKTFITTSLGLLSATTWSKTKLKEKYTSDQLIGKESLKLYSQKAPLLTIAGIAFEKMQKAALKDGVKLKIISAYRSYDQQKNIWNRKFLKNKMAGLDSEDNIKKIIEYSTLPGTSRHHWGTDIDLIDGSKPQEGDVLISEKFHQNGPYVVLRKWMDQHAVNYGFIRPYTKNIERKGFYYEPWHYSYAPIAIPMLKAYSKLDLKKTLATTNLEGSASMSKQFLRKYFTENILGIANELKDF
jgi:LAS superfamily LD-carboxypeptidase LdcB